MKEGTNIMKAKIKTFISSILILVFVLVLAPINITLNAGVTSLTNGATYYVKNKNSQIYLTAANTGADGAYITQEQFTGANNQQWRLIYNGTHWLLSPQNYSLVTTYMNIYGGGTNNGTLLRTWPGTDNASQWQVVSQSSGIFSLRAKENTSKCAEVYNGSQSPGTNIILWSFNTTDNQLWEFELVSSADDHGNTPYDASVFDTMVSFTTRTISGQTRTATVPLTDMMYGSLESGGDIDYFKYIAPYDSFYVFYTTSSIDTYGELTDVGENLLYSTYDGDGNPLVAYNDDGGTGYNFKITYKLNKGQTVYLKVRGYNSSVTGNYWLEVRNYYADLYWAWPYTDTNMNVNISNPYYYKQSDLIWHWGTDIVGIETDGIANTPLYAAQSGTVLKNGYTSGAGYVIRVMSNNIDISKTSSGQNSKNLIYIYEHMVNPAISGIEYSETAPITKGALSGLTGNSSTTRYHLHYQIFVYNKDETNYRNPYKDDPANDNQIPICLANTVNIRKFYDYRISFYSKTPSDLDVQYNVW